MEKCEEVGKRNFAAQNLALAWKWSNLKKTGELSGGQPAHQIWLVLKVKMTGKTPEVRSDKRKPREDTQNHRYHRYNGYHRYHGYHGWAKVSEPFSH